MRAGLGHTEAVQVGAVGVEQVLERGQAHCVFNARERADVRSPVDDDEQQIDLAGDVAVDRGDAMPLAGPR